jgi:hypothetical protein
MTSAVDAMVTVSSIPPTEYFGLPVGVVRAAAIMATLNLTIFVGRCLLVVTETAIETVAPDSLRVFRTWEPVGLLGTLALALYASAWVYVATIP